MRFVKRVLVFVGVYGVTHVTLVAVGDLACVWLGVPATSPLWSVQFAIGVVVSALVAWSVTRSVFRDGQESQEALESARKPSLAESEADPEAAGAATPSPVVAAAAANLRPRSRRPGLALPIALVVLAAAVVLLAALVLIRTGGPRGTSDSDAPVTVAPASPTPTTVSERTRLKRYVGRVDEALLVVWPSNTASIGFRPHDAPLPTPLQYVRKLRPLGLRRMVIDSGDSCRYYWDAELGPKSLERAALHVASGDVPSAMRGANRKLVRVLRMEAERWRRFAAFKDLDGDAFWSRYADWRAWSKGWPAKQQRLLDDWYFTLRVCAKDESVNIPRTTRRFVSVALTCEL